MEQLQKNFLVAHVHCLGKGCLGKGRRGDGWAAWNKRSVAFYLHSLNCLVAQLVAAAVVTAALRQ